MKQPIIYLLLLLLTAQSCTGQSDTLPKTATPPINFTIFPANEPITERAPLYISKDFGQTWENASYNLPNDIEVSFIEKRGTELVIATDNKGIFYSKKNKTEWINIGTELPNPKINALHIHENNILVGVYQAGVYTTTDNGQHWKSLNFDLPDKRVQAILQTKKQLFVGTDKGIFKLKKDKNNWVKISESVQVLSLETHNNLLVAGTSQGTFLSKDNGETWEAAHPKGAIHYTHSVEETIVEMYVSGDVYLSRDNGNTWKSVDYAPRKQSYVYEIVQLNDYWIMSNNYGVHRSEDKGQTWQLIYSTEKMGFFDFFVENNVIYGGTRQWDEYKRRNW